MTNTTHRHASRQTAAMFQNFPPNYNVHVIWEIYMRATDGVCTNINGHLLVRIMDCMNSSVKCNNLFDSNFVADFFLLQLHSINCTNEEYAFKANI